MEIEQSKVEEQIQEKAQEQAQEKAKKNKKKLRMNKQIVISFLAGMAAMLIIVVGVMAAVNQGFLAGSYVNLPNDYGFDKSTGTITAYYGSDRDLIIPSEINGIKVKKIGDWAFLDRSSIISVTIPNSVEVIGTCAFVSCRRLSIIVLPRSVTDIKENAFVGCKYLSYVIFPDSEISIDGNVFISSESLTILGKGGSFAEEYAKTYKFKFESKHWLLDQYHIKY